MAETKTTLQRWTMATEQPDMWVDPADDPRETASVLNDERSTLLDYLGRYRRTLEMKCAGLNDEQLARRSVPPSSMSLLGLIRHMAEVERGWFRRGMARDEAPKLYCTKENRDGDWDGATASPDIVADAWRAWRAEVEFAEGYAARTENLDTVCSNGSQFRDILVHMIEEYARHCGHADLLRECIDGRVGQ